MDNTILVTGGTGYIGSWVVKKLLEKGNTVRVTVRNRNKKEKIALLEGIAARSKGTMEVFEADLLENGSFDNAAKGAIAIIHVASPFTLKFKDPVNDLIKPAVDGTVNVLNAASRSGSVKKVILTSSVAAVHGDAVDMKTLGINEFTEEHFNESSSQKHQPYSYSKVMAEKSAWKLYEKQEKWNLVVINPSFVMGPTLTKYSISESIILMKELLGGKFVMGVPELNFGFVDVRDVAEAHILALEKANAKGRHILVERVASITDLSDMLKRLYPKRFKLPIMKTPKWIVLMLGWVFGQPFKFIMKNVGYPLKFNNRKSVEELGLKYTPLEITIKDMVDQMEKLKLI